MALQLKSANLIFSNCHDNVHGCGACALSKTLPPPPPPPQTGSSKTFLMPRAFVICHGSISGAATSPHTDFHIDLLRKVLIFTFNVCIHFQTNKFKKKLDYTISHLFSLLTAFQTAYIYNNNVWKWLHVKFIVQITYKMEVRLDS